MRSTKLATLGLAVSCVAGVFSSRATGQVAAFFSTELPFRATNPFPLDVSDGDILSTRGRIVATNNLLTSSFCFKPVVPDLGLDGIHLLRDGTVLFSTERGEFNECTSTQVTDGDLLSDQGTVFRTNAQLISNFLIKPIVPDLGLDAVYLPGNGEIWFSTEIDEFDLRLGRLSHGDILSDAGQIVMTNRELVRNFCPKPVFPDFGLDALHVISNGEIWFSTEEGWFDECLGRQISDGDLLSDAGYIVATNFDLTSRFFAISDPVPMDQGLDALALGMEFSACGRIEAGPQGCPIFRPDGENQFYFIENLGNVDPGTTVFVRGILNPLSRLCLPFVAPGIEENVIGPCFEACGILSDGPQGCPILIIPEENRAIFTENTGEFVAGDSVFVRGLINPQSMICGPFTLPGIESNTIQACLSTCGSIVPGPQACPVFLPDGKDVAYLLENAGTFNIGDRVFVRGPVNRESDICPPITTRAVEDNRIGECFSGCGTLVQGVECVLFVPDGSDRRILVSNLGGFAVGSRVRVEGLLESPCFTPCGKGDACIFFNSIVRCCVCDWNADGLLDSRDFFDFLRDFFQGQADVNGDGLTTSQDFFDFLSCFFTTCP